MADKKSAPVVRRKERLVDKKKEAKAEVKEKAKLEVKEKAKEDKAKEKKPAEAATNGEAAVNGTNGVGAEGEAAENGEVKVEPIELPPFEIMSGDRMDPFFYKFQFKNVEYSSGRNKTFLCYLMDPGNDGLLMRGYMEDEHASDHVEEAFFQQVLPYYNPKTKYTVTWYMSSSPCAACAAKVVEILKARPTVRLTIFSARIFMWEEPEIQAGLKALAAAGCKLRAMKPLDFTYTWDTFVDNDCDTFTLWEDCQENYEFYQEKLAELLE
ncbi:C-_U-editing enzyme APOBEC-2a [Sardina pilchardus]|uniref:C->U-editing enzyme APOBEC-2a n=1 Tax=Sardina pilchardus TaxID=27697 RepID=UPI002E130A96